MTRWPILSESRITCCLPTNPYPVAWDAFLLCIYIYIYIFTLYLSFHFYMYRYYFPWSVFQISTYVEAHFVSGSAESWAIHTNFSAWSHACWSHAVCRCVFCFFAKLQWGQPGQEGTTQKHGRLFQTLDIYMLIYLTPFGHPSPNQFGPARSPMEGVPENGPSVVFDEPLRERSILYLDRTKRP